MGELKEPLLPYFSMENKNKLSSDVVDPRLARNGGRCHIWAYLMPYANLLAPCGDLEHWTGSGPAGRGGLKWIGGS